MYIIIILLESTLQLTKDEDALPAGDVAFPVGQHAPAPLGRHHHSHAVGEHLCYRVDEVLSPSRDFLFQTAKPCLKQDGGNTWEWKD